MPRSQSAVDESVAAEIFSLGNIYRLIDFVLSTLVRGGYHPIRAVTQYK